MKFITYHGVLICHPNVPTHPNVTLRCNCFLDKILHIQRVANNE